MSVFPSLGVLFHAFFFFFFNLATLLPSPGSVLNWHAFPLENFIDIVTDIMKEVWQWLAPFLVPSLHRWYCCHLQHLLDFLFCCCGLSSESMCSSESPRQPVMFQTTDFLGCFTVSVASALALLWAQIRPFLELGRQISSNGDSSLNRECRRSWMVRFISSHVWASVFLLFFVWRAA